MPSTINYNGRIFEKWGYDGMEHTYINLPSYDIIYVDDFANVVEN